MTDEKLRLFVAERVKSLTSGEHASQQFRTRGHDHEEKRKFRLGDDPRSIDILGTAKHRDGSLKVSINRVGKGANIIFLVDSSASTRFGTIVEKYQYAVEFVGQITSACLGGGNRFRFMAFNEKIVYDSGFKMSASAANESLEELACLPTDRSATDLAAALAELSATAGQLSLNLPSIVFIISDFLLEINFNLCLADLGEYSDIIAIALQDPAEISVPHPRFGFVRLNDPETGKSFLARMPKPHLDNMGLILRKCGAEWLELNTEESMGKALKKLIELFETKRERERE